MSLPRGVYHQGTGGNARTRSKISGILLYTGKRTGFKCQSSNFISLNIFLKFVYFLQCCNDVVQERFASELKYEMALKLAALHIYQYALSCNMTGKIHLKNIE